MGQNDRTYADLDILMNFDAFRVFVVEVNFIAYEDAVVNRCSPKPVQEGAERCRPG